MLSFLCIGHHVWQLAMLAYYVSGVSYTFCLLGFFFFSSRRRHTRCLSDWSSDVCSSDLAELAVQQGDQVLPLRRRGCASSRRMRRYREPFPALLRPGIGVAPVRLLSVRRGRSEERRVGKECRDGAGRRTWTRQYEPREDV